MFFFCKIGVISVYLVKKLNLTKMRSLFMKRNILHSTECVSQSEFMLGHVKNYLKVFERLTSCSTSVSLVWRPSSFFLFSPNRACALSSLICVCFKVLKSQKIIEKVNSRCFCPLSSLKRQK